MWVNTHYVLSERVFWFEAKRRLRFTNIHSLIVSEEKLFLHTCCDHFLAAYEDLIDYVQAIGELVCLRCLNTVDFVIAEE